LSRCSQSFSLERLILQDIESMTFGTNYREDVVLTNGLRIRFRTVTPSDKQKLAESFAHLSAESRYRRLF
jgi:hypothetical protein